VGVKWKVHRLWRAEPGTDVGMLVGRIVVDYGMDKLAGRHFALNGAQEADELLVAVTLHQRPMTLPFSVECGEQRGGAIRFVDAMGRAARTCDCGAATIAKRCPHATAKRPEQISHTARPGNHADRGHRDEPVELACRRGSCRGSSAIL
jgi:hypothetical protein